MSKKILKQVCITLTPEEIAKAFCSMSDDEQADFFNVVADEVHYNWTNPFCFQVRNILDNPRLTYAGLNILKDIYSEQVPTPQN